VASILRRDSASGGEALILPLSGPGAAPLTARLHARFDWIVLDCGPLAGAGALLAHEKTADAAVIVDAAETDATVLKAAADRAGIAALVAGAVRTPARSPGRAR
jgi:Mrp family chromosome partitioning ATPase